MYEQSLPNLAIPHQTLTEAMLESAIHVACVELEFAISMPEQLEVFHRIQDLHRQRTLTQVKRMQVGRGAA